MVGRADKGLLITTGSFTKEARREAQREGAPPLDLIDGEALAEKLKELGMGVTIRQRTVEDVAVNMEFLEAYDLSRRACPRTKVVGYEAR